MAEVTVQVTVQVTVPQAQVRLGQFFKYLCKKKFHTRPTTSDA